MDLSKRISRNSKLRKAAMESLEDRTLFSTISWLGGSGSFTDPTKWAGGVAPGPNDVAQIVAAGTYTVDVPSNVSVSALTLGPASGTQTLQVDSGVHLKVTNGIAIGGSGSLSLRAGTVTATTLSNGGNVTVVASMIDAVVDNRSDLNVMGGTTFTGGITNENGAAIDIEQANVFVVAGGIDNHGDVAIDSELPGNSSILNLNNAAFTNESDGSLEDGNGTTGTVQIQFSSLNNIGNIDFGEPTEVIGSVDNNSSGFSVDGTVSLNVLSGTLSNNGLIDIGSGQQLIIVNGTFSTNSNNGNFGLGINSILTFQNMSVTFSNGFDFGGSGTLLRFFDSDYDGGQLVLESGNAVLGGSSINADLLLAGQMTVVGDMTPSSVQGAFTFSMDSAGGNINIVGDSNGPAILTVPDGLDMTGVLTLTSDPMAGGDAVIQTATPGGHITVEGEVAEIDIEPGGGGARTIDANLDIEGDLNILADLTVTGDLVNGNTEADGIDLEGSTLTAGDGFENRAKLAINVVSNSGSTIIVQSGGSGVGLLTNAILGSISTGSGFSTPNTIEATVSNGGRININQPTEFKLDGTSFTNEGESTLGIDSVELLISSGSFSTHDINVQYSNNPTLMMDNVQATVLDSFDQTEGTLRIVDGSTFSGGTLTVESGAEADLEGTIASDIDNLGMICVESSLGGVTSTFSGAVTTEDGSLIELEAESDGVTTLIVPAGFTNTATLSLNGLDKTAVTLATPSDHDSIFNQGSLLVNGKAFIQSSLDNSADFQIAGNLSVTILQNESTGTIELNAGELDVFGSANNFAGGVITMGMAGGMGVTFKVFNSDGFAGDFSNDATLHISAGLTTTSTFSGILSDSNSSSITVDSPARLDFGGASDNNGQIMFNAHTIVTIESVFTNDVQAVMYINGADVTFSGGTYLNVSGSFTRIAGANGAPATLTLPGFENDGDILLDPNESNGIATLNVIGSLVNVGTLESTAPDPFVNITGGSNTGEIKSQGTLNIDLGGGIFTDTGDIHLDGGTINFDHGTYTHLAENGATFSTSSGAQLGLGSRLVAVIDGTLNGALVNGGDLSVDGGLTVGSYSQKTSGTLEIPLVFNGSVFQPDTFDVQGTATIQGGAIVVNAPGYTPHVGDLFDLIDYSQLIGGFSTSTLPASATVSSTLVVASAELDLKTMPKADLSVTTVAYSPGIYIRGGNIAASATIVNSSSTAAGAFVTKFVLSTDQILGNGDDVLLATTQSAGIAGNSSLTLTPTLTLPGSIPGGNYFLLVQTDATNTIDESNVKNNVFTSSAANLDIFASDPPPTARLTSAPNVTTVGMTFYDFTITFTDNTAVDVTTFGSGDVRVTGPNGFSQLATLLSGAAVTNGKTRSASYRISAPGGAFDSTNSGTYTITLVGGQIADTAGDSSPETALGTFNVNTAAGNPDLVVSSVSYSSGTFSAGSTLAISSKITNSGNLPAGAFAENYYLSTDSILGNSDDILIGSISVSGLVAGASRTATDLVQIPIAAPAASYFVIGQADGANVITESNESNNIVASATANITVTAPALARPVAKAPPLKINAATYSFKLRFATQLTNSDLSGTQARVTGANNYTQVAALQNLTFDPQLGSTIATYQITASSGSWTTRQNGTYSIFFEPSSAIASLAGASSKVGSFLVAISGNT